MRFVIAAGLLAVAALVQSLAGPSLPIVRGRPDLVLVGFYLNDSVGQAPYPARVRIPRGGSR
jgi:hypothetical protein